MNAGIGGSQHGSAVRKPPPPSWPVITLSFTGDGVTADPSGVGDLITVSPYPGETLHDAALAASLAAARKLNVARCRVQGSDEDGTRWLMVVDVDAETLEETTEPARSTPTTAGARRGVGGRVRSLGAFARSGKGRVTAVAATTVLVGGSVLGVLVWQETRNQVPVTSSAPPVPDAAQLPVPAPTGWDTYAQWAIEAEPAGAEPVLTSSGVLIATDGADVLGIDADTGATIWRAGTSSNVSALALGELDGEEVLYAAHSRRGVTTLSTSGRTLSSADVDSAEAVAVGAVPFAELRGQRGAVLLDGRWQARVVPATASPVGAIADALVSVSVEQQRVWLTTSDDAELPAAQELTAPADGLTLASVVAFSDDRMVLAWQGEGRALTLSTVRITPAGALQELGVAAGPQSLSVGASVDAANDLMAVGNVLIDLDTGERLASTTSALEARAGYGWTAAAAGQRVRVAPDGEEVELNSAAALPSLILPNGNALVVADYGATETAYYSLIEEKETARADD